MLIELCRGVTLQSGMYAAVIAPDHILAAAFGSDGSFRKYRTVFVLGTGYGAPPLPLGMFPEAEVSSAGNARDLIAAIRESSHTLVFVGHDPGLFSGTEKLVQPAASAFSAAGRESLVLLHARSRDPVFSALARYAARRIEIIPLARASLPLSYEASLSGRLPRAQTRLGVS